MPTPRALRLAEQFCGDWELIDDDAAAALARLIDELVLLAHAAGRAEALKRAVGVAEAIETGRVTHTRTVSEAIRALEGER